MLDLGVTDHDGLSNARRGDHHLEPGQQLALFAHFDLKLKFGLLFDNFGRKLMFCLVLAHFI